MEIEFKAANYSGTYSALTTGSGTIKWWYCNGNRIDSRNLYFRVTDDVTNCFAEATVIVNEPTALTLTEVLNVNATCTDARTVAAAGGTTLHMHLYQLVLQRH
jgi:hypothetical protein